MHAIQTRDALISLQRLPIIKLFNEKEPLYIFILSFNVIPANDPAAANQSEAFP